MQFRSVLVLAMGLGTLAGYAAMAAEKAVTAGTTGLAINNSGRLNLVTSVPIDYLNRAIASGRRVVNLRLAQPLLCADFATPPGGGVNPVALQYSDPNGDSTPLLFGGITSFDYVTNGASASLFKVSSSAELACCAMLPASNASCFQGNVGGSVGDGVFANGYEQLASSPEGGPADLVVSISGPAGATPGSNFAYTIQVQNTGSAQIDGVRVRDWFPKASGGFPAPLSAGSWTCSPMPACGTAAGSGNIALDAVSLAGNSSISFNVSRTLNAGATLSSQFSVSAAAFAPPATAEAQLGNNQAALTATVQQTNLSISDVTQAEGNSGSSAFQFTITRSNTADAVSVLVSTADGSANAGSDYSSFSQTINFSAGGPASQVVNISVNGDTTLEGNETFTVNLSNPVNAGILDGQGVGTINNDDSASLTINDVTQAEGNSGSSNFTFTVTLNNAVQGGFTLPASTSDGSATAGSDYTSFAGGPLNFTGNAGETRTLNVAVLGDTVLEPNETFNVNLGSPSNAAVTIADGTGVGTINNDDAASLAINDVTQVEGNAGSSNFTFTVTLTGAVQGGFTLPVSSANGSATAGSDYTAFSGGPLSFTGSAGETRTVNISVNGDTTLEANETFQVNLGAPSNAAVTIGDGSGTGTINNDDSASIAINDLAVTEGNSGTTNASFTVTLTGSVQGGFTVAASTSSGTATAGSDFVNFTGGPLNFAGTAGETQQVVVQVNGDSMLETDEIYFVNLGIPSNGAVLLGDSQGIGTINNDDAASLAINSVAVTEGNTGSTVNATFTVTLSGSVQGSFLVPVSSADGTATVANNDYVAIAGGSNLTFAGTAGETQQISVVVNGDNTVEPNETFTVNLGTPGNAAVTLSTGTGTGTINNDDTPSGVDKRR